VELWSPGNPLFPWVPEDQDGLIEGNSLSAFL
jgi:hypothetical protein